MHTWWSTKYYEKKLFTLFFFQIVEGEFFFLLAGLSILLKNSRQKNSGWEDVWDGKTFWGESVGGGDSGRRRMENGEGEVVRSEKVMEERGGKEEEVVVVVVVNGVDN